MEYLWPFDSTFQDLSGTFNTVPQNGSNFSSKSITGYGSSLSLSSSLAQCLLILNPQLNLYDQSWTFEAWIYPTNLSDTRDFAIVGQCKRSSDHECLHLVIRSQKLYLGLYADDTLGNTVLTTFRWYHVAFVFDCDTRTKSVYLDGVLDGSGPASRCFQGYNQSSTFGRSLAYGMDQYFDGLIDQLSYTTRAKTPEEILRDATLVVSFSFDNNSIFDRGPLRINGSLIGNTSFVPGRVGQALEIRNANASGFQVQGLVLLGTSNRPYSFAIWIRPSSQQGSVIIHTSSTPDFTGWYIPLLGLTNTSRLMTYSLNGNTTGVSTYLTLINIWTHAAVTYSRTTGLRLYVNGTLLSASAPFAFTSPETPMYLLVGRTNSYVGCREAFSLCGSYSGAVDEFRLYSRELSAGDVAALANP